MNDFDFLAFDFSDPMKAMEISRRDFIKVFGGGIVILFNKRISR